jgi:hypothetical protein
MDKVCLACGKRVYMFNYDKANGRVGLTMAWRHYSRWVRHRPIVEEGKRR